MLKKWARECWEDGVAIFNKVAKESLANATVERKPEGGEGKPHRNLEIECSRKRD